MPWAILIGFLTPEKTRAFYHRAIGIYALLAAYGGQASGLYSAGEPAGFIGSVIGAIIVLAI